VGYRKGARNYKLTPSRKALVKAVARRSNWKVAKECTEDENTARSACIIKSVGTMVHKEMQLLCGTYSGLSLRSNSTEDLRQFSWQALNKKLEKKMPVLIAILRSTGVVNKDKANFNTVISLCVLLLARNRNPKMNLVSKILSLILYAGHTAKDVSVMIQINHMYNYYVQYTSDVI